MARSIELIKQLTAQRDKLQAEVDALQKQLDAARHRLEGAESMLRTATGEPEPAARPRPQVKQMILDMLSARGPDGVNATMVVELASQRNERVERGTVSSLLSRFKAEGLVFYDGKVYRLAKYASTAASTEAPAMH